MSPKDAIIEAMNFAFPTILTSGTILAVSGILISFMTTECTINGIGDALGRGTIISIVLVMFVLPQILILGGKILEKTSFSMPTVNHERRGSGMVAVDGLVTGEIHGSVNGLFRGTIEGDVDLRLLSGKADFAEAAPEPEQPPAESEAEAPAAPADAKRSEQKEAGTNE